jgi:hypothetical protein
MKQPLPRFETAKGDLPLGPTDIAEWLRFSQLTPPRQALIRICQTINFGSIENLEIRDSEPTFDPPPVMLRDLKLDSDDGPRPELALADFIVGNEIVRLMGHLDEMKLGNIRRVEVRGGLPRRIVLEQMLSRFISTGPCAGFAAKLSQIRYTAPAEALTQRRGRFRFPPG